MIVCQWYDKQREREGKKSSWKRISNEKDEQLHTSYCTSWCKRGGCLLGCRRLQPCPLPSPSPRLSSPPYTLQSIRSFPLISIQRCRGSLLSSLPPSVWLLRFDSSKSSPLAPYPAIVDVSRPIIVTRRRRTGKRERDAGGKRGDFPLPPPTSVGVSMSRCVGHCEGTTAPGILPFIRNRVISVHVSCVAPSLIGLHAFLHRVLFHFVPISFRPLSFSVRRNRTATKNKNPVKIQCSDSSALLSGTIETC